MTGGTVVQALVARGVDQGLAVEDVHLPPPGAGEVRVRIQAAGVCHSDLSMVNGTLAPPFPLVLGHEAAGVVAEVGPGVDRVRVADHVVLNWSPACRKCWFCRRGEPWLCETSGTPAAVRGATADGTPMNVTLGLGALAEEVVVPAAAVIPVPADLPFETAALLGCAVLTGMGAVRNTAGVTAGDSVLVIGLGGVGLAAVTAARAVGAAPVLAADVSPAKRELALAAGATEFLTSDETLPKAVRARTGGRGVDHAFECVGRSVTIQAAWRSSRRGGQVTVIGMGRKDDLVCIGALDLFHWARTLRSSVYGSSDPDREVPELAAAVLSGALDLDPLITHRTTLAGTADAFERMGRGEGARSIVLFD
ncbi:MAG TPA: Zn-dependent alcohol dehydrogenase [Mycobacteriales bacterium]|nr:Zn-dependent alcohol dehydrogenase [Mycobacteriales bacterium]